MAKKSARYPSTEHKKLKNREMTFFSLNYARESYVHVLSQNVIVTNIIGREAAPELNKSVSKYIINLYSLI